MKHIVPITQQQPDSTEHILIRTHCKAHSTTQTAHSRKYEAHCSEHGALKMKHISPCTYSTKYIAQGRQAYVGGSEAPSGNETLIGALRSNGLTLFLYLFTLVNSFASFHHIHPLSLPTLNQSSAFFSSDFSYFDLRFSAICGLIGAQWPWVRAFKQIGARSGPAFK